MVAETDTALVIGSQAILGSFTEDVLPDEAIRSIEADVAFLNDPADRMSDEVDGALGELSQFHETFGYYAQGVSVSTAVLPVGWEERLVLLDTPATAPGRGLCLEPHDLAASKLVAHRGKDLEFVTALLRAGLLQAPALRQRVNLLPITGSRKRLLNDWLDAAAGPP